MPMLVRLSLVMTLLVAVVSGEPAYAGDPSIRKPKAAEAVEHLTRGNKLYNVRSFEQAAAEYKAGALVEPAPIFDYNLGQCYRQLKQYTDAIWHYERFAKASPETPDHVATVQKFIADMKAELTSKAMSEPPTEPGPTTATATPTASPPPPTSSAVASTATVSTSSNSPAAEPWYSDGLGWGLAGAGFVSVVVGTGFLFNASNLSDEANGTASQETAADLRSKADTRQLLGAVLGIGGAGLLATGVIKLAIHASTKEAPRVSMGLWGHGLLVFGNF